MNIAMQIKESRKETKERLDALIVAQHETNRLLSALLAALASRPAGYPPSPH